MWHHEKKCSFTLLPCILGHWRQTPKTTLNEPPLSYAHTKQWINARESFQECRIQCNLHTHRQSVFLLRISIDVREKKRKKRIEMDDVDIEKNNKWKTFGINCNFTKRVWFGVTWRDVCVSVCSWTNPPFYAIFICIVSFTVSHSIESSRLVSSLLNRSTHFFYRSSTFKRWFIEQDVSTLPFSSYTSIAVIWIRHLIFAFEYICHYSKHVIRTKH